MATHGRIVPFSLDQIIVVVVVYREEQDPGVSLAQGLEHRSLAQGANSAVPLAPDSSEDPRERHAHTFGGSDRA